MNWYPEPFVARAVGVQKNVLVRARQAGLEKGADWALVDSVVSYSPAGLAKLCTALQLDQALVEATKNSEEATTLSGESAAAEASLGRGEAVARDRTPVQEPAPGRNPVPAFARRDPAATIAAAADELAVKSAPVWIEVTAVPGNTIIVHGRLEGKPVTVRVRSNANFVPGLWVRATPLNDSSYFAMVGNPPRWKGDRHGFLKPKQGENDDVGE